MHIFKKTKLFSFVAVLTFSISSWTSADYVKKPLEIYDKVTKIVTENFYDRNFRGIPWSSRIQQYRRQISIPITEKQFKEIINELLGELETSHTVFLSDSDQEYWVLKAIFSRKIDGAPLYQIGSWFSMEDEWYVRNVFENSPAERAGIVRGDRIIKVNGNFLNPVKSFLEKNIVVELKRNISEGPRIIKIKSELKGFQEILYRASEASTKVYSKNKKKIGYFHLWSGTHPKFEKLLKKVVKKMAKESDVFILDLRDGFGGAHPGYLDSFFDKSADGEDIKRVYSKPMIVLINEGTRSGKEWLAYILKERNRALLIGSRTAGAFIGGKPFEIMPKKYLLFLAVDGNGPPGVDIEGKGVFPHIEVLNPLPYSSGKDFQLEKALDIATAVTIEKNKNIKNP